MPADQELDECADNIEQLERYATSLGKLGKALEKGSNVASTIRKIEEETDNGQALASETGRYLKTKLSDKSLDHRTRLRVEKLGRQYEAAGTRFETVSLQVLAARKNVKDSDITEERDVEAGPAGGSKKPELEQSLLNDSEMQHKMANVLERNNELRQLETDLSDLHTLFKDVATLAHMQQEVTHPAVSCALSETLIAKAVVQSLDTIESAVTEANVRVSGGVNELVKAHKRQKAARKRMCCMVTTGTFVLIILLWGLIGPSH
mmetsp:Transcript_2526/g.4076  ORF Transcript_2526/g.4076 Transcript_2526/m.4076 type:complete len:263 (-) Transcript_2526:2559-3347(-)